MPERFEIFIVYKRRYINALPFLSFLMSQNVLQGGLHTLVFQLSQ